ncbi:glycosyltransferase [Kineosporia sp. J2-2]|uniref:Glycosyltransferase n=1 Tax=Kineosporia corallincola TaxID=2835133 RepID=A0ABS5TIR2_9ACTN|nr:glycosyltransferase [Kineosporia corallincola]MBT0769464.1 glycosyltransferase [Kineosporia corallincola]
MRIKSGESVSVETDGIEVVHRDDPAPVLTVVVCAYNDQERVKPTAASIARQSSLSGVQTLLIDGASSDGTIEAARAHLPGLTVSSERDGGVYQAMNRALVLARGEYVYFLNCGDVLHDDRVLERLVTELRLLTRPVPLLACRVRHLDGGRGAPFVTRTIPFSLWRLLLGRQDYNHQAMIFHRVTSLAAGGFSMLHGVAGDYHLILRLALMRAPMTREMVLSDYEGGGLSAADAHLIPRLHAAVREEVLDLRGPLRRVNRWYGSLQSLRRETIRWRRREQAHKRSGTGPVKSVE